MLAGNTVWMGRSWRALLCLALLLASTQSSSADIGGFFNNLGNSLKDAGNTIKTGAESTFQVVKNGTVDAANATGVMRPYNKTIDALPKVSSMRPASCKGICLRCHPADKAYYYPHSVRCTRSITVSAYES